MKINNLNKEGEIMQEQVKMLNAQIPQLEMQIEGLDKENRKWKRELEEALREIDALRQAVNIAEEGKWVDFQNGLIITNLLLGVYW